MQLVSIKTQQFLWFFFLRNQHKNLVRDDNDMIDVNNIFHKIFILCNLDLWFKWQILWSPSESVWSSHKGTQLGSWSSLAVCVLLFLEDRHLAKYFYAAWVRSCLVFLLNDNVANVRRAVGSGSHHRVCWPQGINRAGAPRQCLRSITSWS